MPCRACHLGRARSVHACVAVHAASSRRRARIGCRREAAWDVPLPMERQMEQEAAEAAEAATEAEAEAEASWQARPPTDDAPRSGDRPGATRRSCSGTASECDFFGACRFCAFFRLVLPEMESPSEPSLRTRRFCVVCGNAARFKCGGCECESYCSSECQKQQWPIHSVWCRDEDGGVPLLLRAGPAREVSRSIVLETLCRPAS